MIEAMQRHARSIWLSAIVTDSFERKVAICSVSASFSGSFAIGAPPAVAVGQITVPLVACRPW